MRRQEDGQREHALLRRAERTQGRAGSLQTRARHLVASRQRHEVQGEGLQPITEARFGKSGQQPATVMFIGLSGSGKSTLAHGLERRLFDMGRVATVLDGKAMRLGISKDLPHDQEGRAENLRRSANVAKFLNESGLICCAAFVAPNKDSREHAQSVIGKEHCIIVYLNPSLEVCRLRDPSGLYAAAELSGTPDLPGVSFPYDEPENPDLVLDTERLSVEKCITQLVKLLKSRKII